MFKSPEGLARAIQENRKQGPHLPSAKQLRHMALKEESYDGMRLFRASPLQGGASSVKVLYLHGGAHVLDLQQIQWNLVSGLLARLQGEIVIPIYPLAPEAVWHQSLNAVQELYLNMVEQGAQHIVICGDSSGGGLALLLAQSLRDSHQRPPTATVLFSPWLDLSLQGGDQPDLQRRDPVLSIELARLAGKMWAGDLPLDDPSVSPLFGNLEYLPPMMVFSGSREILDSDALRLASLCPDVIHRHYPDMLHVWPVGPLREGRQALDEAADFIRQQLPIC